MGEVGWIKLLNTMPMDAEAGPGLLRVWSGDYGTDGLPYVWHVHAPDPGACHFRNDRWELPHLTVHVDTAMAGPAVRRRGDVLEVTYTSSGTAPNGLISVALRFHRHSPHAVR